MVTQCERCGIDSDDPRAQQACAADSPSPYHSFPARRLVGVTNAKTGEFIAAPSHCPFCGVALGEVIRHIMVAMFEVTCENDSCGKTCIVHNDHVKL